MQHVYISWKKRSIDNLLHKTLREPHSVVKWIWSTRDKSVWYNIRLLIFTICKLWANVEMTFKCGNKVGSYSFFTNRMINNVPTIRLIYWCHKHDCYHKQDMNFSLHFQGMLPRKKKVINVRKWNVILSRWRSLFIGANYNCQPITIR